MKKVQQKAGSVFTVPAVVPALILIVFSFLLYSNTLNHSYTLDDDIVSRGNRFVQMGFEGIPDIFSHGFFYGFNGNNDQAYRPIPLMTLAVETGYWGESPGIHHLFNVLYYALACGLLFLVLRRMFRDSPVIVPFLMALLFASHPVHTECVANFKSRDEVLNLLFMLLMIWFLFRFADTRKGWAIAFSALFFSVSLMTKEQSVSFLAVIPLLLYWFSTLSLKKILLVTAPFLLLTAGYFILRSAVLDSLTFTEAVILDNNSLVAATSAADRMATALLILGKYVLVLLFPHPLSYDYSFNQIPVTGFSQPAVLLVVLLFVSAGLASVLYLRKRNIFVFAFLWFIVTISAVSNLFFLIGTTMGERFLLIPSIAFCIAVVWTGTLGAERMERFGGKQGLRIFYAVILLLVAVCSFLTLSRNRVWKDNLTLYTSGVKTSPESYRTQLMLAFELATRAKEEPSPDERRRLIETAEKHYRLSLGIYPRSVLTLYNYAILKLESGFPSEAIELFAKATEADPLDYNSWHNLAVVSFQEQRFDSALRYFLKLEQLKPGDPAIIDAIGVAYSRKNDYDNAVGYFQKALTIDPTRMRTYDKLIELLVNHGDTARARYYRGMALMNGR